MSQRLARAKAAVLAAQHPQAWVLGSDQSAECRGRLLGKPGQHAAAVAQLMAASGQTLQFHTAVALMRGTQCWEAQDVTAARFRTLEADEIERYLRAEQPYDCAGSFKCEGLGISLFESLETQDPTALIGLPLIATARLLRQVGLIVP